MTPTHSRLPKALQTTLTLLSNMALFAYSFFLLTTPFLNNRHPLSQMLQISNSSSKSYSNGREVEQIIYVAIFNVLISLFNITAIILPITLLRHYFISLFLALLLAVSNLILAMLLNNLKSILNSLTVPQNTLVYEWGQYSWRGNAHDFTQFFNNAVIFAFLICMPASICNVAFWKQNFVSMLRYNTTLNNSNKNGSERNTNDQMVQMPSG